MSPSGTGSQDQESYEGAKGARRTRSERVAPGDAKRSPSDDVIRSADPLPTASDLRDLRIEQRPIASLMRRRRNPRTHSEKQIRQIADSIETFGFTNPVLIDASDTVIAGHGRVRAAKQLGLSTVPTLRLEHLTEAQIRAYVIADNRLAENAGWDRDLLALELQELAELDLGFDLEVIGFETGDRDRRLGTKRSRSVRS